MFHTVLLIVLCVIAAYFLFSVGYIFIFSVAGKLFYKQKFNKEATNYRKIAVLVPAYKEDGIILSTAQYLLKQDYPKEFYDVYIIADSFLSETINTLKQLPLQVIEVKFDKSTKTKSLNKAFEQIPDQYDIALICDADNILATDFLQYINSAFANGAVAVQGCRVAKNLDTPFAILDACSEAINNHIFRKGANALGFSSAIIGSGMAYEYHTVKNILGSISAVGGFDKILQLQVVASKNKIYYLADALVYDEKVSSSQAFKQQRKRWVSSQFIYLKRFFVPAFKYLLKGNLDYFNLAVLNNIILPRIFLIAILPLFALVAFFINKTIGIICFAAWIIYLFSLLLGIPAPMYNKQLLVALLRLPKAFLIMLGTLLHLKKANKTFIHTVHTKTEVSNDLFGKK